MPRPLLFAQTMAKPRLVRVCQAVGAIADREGSLRHPPKQGTMSLSFKASRAAVFVYHWIA